MLIAGFPAGPWGTNCYVVATAPGPSAWSIDPGKDATEGVAEVVREHRLKPVVGAGHPRTRRPHVVRRPGRRGVRRDRLDPPGRPAPAHRPDGRDVRRDRGDAARRRLRVRRARRRRRSWATAGPSSWPASSSSSTTRPGHTGGSVTFRTPYGEQDVSEVMFSGDLLFAGSIGRTDLPGGDHPTMLRSLADQGAAAAPTTSWCCPGTASRPSIGPGAGHQPVPPGPDGRRTRSPEDCEHMSKPPR